MKTSTTIVIGKPIISTPVITQQLPIRRPKNKNSIEYLSYLKIDSFTIKLPIRVTGLISPYPIVVKLTNENQNASGMLINKLLSGSDVVSFSEKKIKAPKIVDAIIRKKRRRFKIAADLDKLKIMTLRPG